MFAANGEVQDRGKRNQNKSLQQGGTDQLCQVGPGGAGEVRGAAVDEPVHRPAQHPGGPDGGGDRVTVGRGQEEEGEE